MKDLYYYLASITYFALIVAGSILIHNVDTIFEFVATISVNALSFLFPSIFYFIARSKYKADIESETNKNNFKISKAENKCMIHSMNI